jgi:hypothetical protein
MIDRIGTQVGQPLEAFRTVRPTPPPPPPPPPPPSPVTTTLDSDQNQVRGSGLTQPFDLPPLPFDRAPASPVAGGTPEALSLRDWRNVVVATHQAGMGGLLDSVARDLALRAPGNLEDLPIAFDQRSSVNRATSRWTLNVAQRTNGLGFQESTKQLALLAGETSTDRPSSIAAFKLAHRLGGHTEAEHILFRTAQRAQNEGDALATARRALENGYPDAAKFAYYKAASLAPNANDSLAAAREASAHGLKFEQGEDAFEAWKRRQHDQFTRMEGPNVGPGAVESQSPYRQLPLAKARYINPYLAAMLKADRADFPRIAQAADAAGEHQTAVLITSRARIGQAPTGT